MEMNRFLFRLVVFLFVAICFYSTKANGNATLPPEEVDAMKAILKNKIRELPRADNFSPNDCEDKDYVGVIKCDCTLHNNTTCGVTQLVLESKEMGGPIPKDIAKLKYLTRLDLSGNMLNGPIPEELANLTKLQELSLDNNELKGPIPSFLGKMRELKTISLYNNWLEGRIPPELGELPKLEVLYLDNNVLSGEIPKDLGNITTLVNLDLYDNMLEGPLPDEFGNLTMLEELGLSNNRFTGTLPSTFKEMTKLEELAVTNLLGGGQQGFQFPNLSSLTKIQVLVLSNCSLTGQIPNYIWQLRELKYLDLSFNSLTGGIPPSIGPHSLSTVYLRSNQLNQSLPRWLIHKNITYVDVSENFFINESLNTDTASANLNLFKCCPNVTVESPSSANFRCSENFEEVYINCGGPKLSINGSNNYEGDEFKKGGSTFYLSPSRRWGYSSMGVYGTNENYYTLNRTCNLTMDDPALYQTARIAPISLKYFACLKKNKYFVKLHFAEIEFQSSLAPHFKDRRVFDVDIQGKKFLTNFNIEAEANGVDKEKDPEGSFKVDDDSPLEIHLFWAGKGRVEDPTPYYGPLISGISIYPVPNKHKKLTATAIALIAVSASLSVILILVLLWRLGCIGGKNRYGKGLKGVELYPGGVFSFQQIKAATQNFDASNKLGEGGFGTVYKGVLPDGTEIAVKQFSRKSRQGIHEFVTEIGTRAALQHPNLVRLLGCCAEDNQLLIIYEYMKYNSLQNALFGSEEIRQKLNWAMRVKICIGVAKALAFLHEESKLKIIHSDIKPSNILLDDDFNAKISDFGFARPYDEETLEANTKVAGTMGYMAPEYIMRRSLTNKADVYSFGVVLLEIVSGKNNACYKPNDQTVFLLEMAYVLHQNGDLLKLVDPSLGPEYNVKQASTILDLAMLCTNPSPTLRPNMSDVVKVLEGKTKVKTLITSSVPYSIDDFALAKTAAGFSQSTHSDSSGSHTGISSTTTNISHSASKEIEPSRSGDSGKTSAVIIEQGEKSTNESVFSPDNSSKSDPNDPGKKSEIDDMRN